MKAGEDRMGGWGEAWGFVCKLVFPPAKLVWAALSAAVVSYWLGAPDGLRELALAAVALVVLDTISGAYLALREHRFSSGGFGQSTNKMVAYLLGLLASVPISTVLHLDYTLVMVVLMLIATRESISLIEKLNALGFPLPEWVKQRLVAVQDGAQTGPNTEETRDGNGAAV